MTLNNSSDDIKRDLVVVYLSTSTRVAASDIFNQIRMISEEF